MKRALQVLLFLFLWCTPGLQAAKTRVSLLLSHSSVKPGETVTAALRLVSEPGTHTYWRNPGDAGTATSIEWKLPAGVSAGAIEWPVPDKIVISKLQDYVYAQETLLLIPLKIAPNTLAGTIKLVADVNWLECDDKNCVPANGKVQSNLTIAKESSPSESNATIEQWRHRLPETASQLKTSGQWEGSGDSTRKLLLEWKPDATPEEPDFWAYEDSAAIGPDTEVLEATAGKVRLRKTVTKPETGPWPAEVHGIVVNGQGEKRRGFEVNFAIAPLPGDAPAGATGVNGQLDTPASSGSLLTILGFAFLGGLILNVMPCVLPVIALKILGFVNQSHEEPRRIRELGLVYMLGVLASFLALAGALLAARSAAGDVNWGMQMQNPYFVVAMLVLVTLVSLNLWGVYEITLPGQALGAAGALASREGRGGAFYNGVLATLLATPCSAPFLGAAIGAVITRPPALVILTFLMVGLGLAAPYVVLSFNPRLLKFLPKPGPWMEKFKHAMGFPMAATAIWLWSFGGGNFGDSGGLWLGLFLLFIAVGAWVYGDFAQRGRSHQGSATIVAVMVVVIGYAFTLEHELRWREPRIASASDDIIVTEPGGIEWRRWNPDAIAKARAEGHPVLIDFTAKWCLTCQLNKTRSIEIDSVKEKLKEMNAKAFLADFTRRDPKIGAGIRSYGRAGIPLVLVLPADPSASPILLPEGPFGPASMLQALELASNGRGLQARK